MKTAVRWINLFFCRVLGIPITGDTDFCRICGKPKWDH